MNIAKGDLAARIARNIKRLDCGEYSYPEVLARKDGWAGDWAGRTLLALCEQYEATNGRDEALLARICKIIEGLLRYVNRDGYFGAPLDTDAVDEQQLSGNSWYLRALCDCYRITGDGKILRMLQRIADTFLKKLAPSYRRYPEKPTAGEGGVSGQCAANAVNGWYLSSDVGCAFILLDGITDCCDVLGDGELIDLAKTVADRFLTFDVYALRFQTHATLSATRGIVRLARQTGEARYLAAAERLFALYEQKGCTINYANFNWFARPDSWTEPCAFLDSLILACELYRETGKEHYLRFSNRVYCNAVRCAQRANGGAGCETCLSEQNNVLRCHMYEAFFCCSMRLANGLNYIRKRLFEERDGAVQINFALDGCYESPTLAFSFAFDAENGEVALTVERGSIRTLRLYLPAGAQISAEAGYEGCFAVLHNLNAGAHRFSVSVPVLKEVRCGREVYFQGDFLLTKKHYPSCAKGVIVADGRELSPIGDCIAAEETVGIDGYIESI